MCSRAFYQPPPVEETPKIIVPDSRNPIESCQGTQIFSKKIELEGSRLFSIEELEALVNLDEGKEISMAVLLLIVQELTSYYVSQGYFLSKAFTPAQKLNDGIIKINIAEGNINKVKVNVNELLDSEDIEDRFIGLLMKIISENKSLKEHCLS